MVYDTETPVHTQNPSKTKSMQLVSRTVWMPEEQNQQGIAGSPSSNYAQKDEHTYACPEANLNSCLGHWSCDFGQKGCKSQCRDAEPVYACIIHVSNNKAPSELTEGSHACACKIL